jgi:MFS superfamily sulfate permease-like transporter
VRGAYLSFSPWELLIYVIENLKSTHFLTFVVSMCSISFCLVIRQLKKTVDAIYFLPEILITILVTTLLSYLFTWTDQGVAILKDVQGGMIAPRIPHGITIERIDSLFLSAALIALIGFVESIAVAKTYGAEYGYRYKLQSHPSISPNRELVALGAGNLIASFFGSWPVFVRSTI